MSFAEFAQWVLKVTIHIGQLSMIVFYLQSSMIT